MAILYVVYFVLLCQSIHILVVKSVATISTINPIVVNLRSSYPEKKWIIARTRPLFFQRIFGIVPGQKWDFDTEKMKLIEKSGLFKNLTIEISQSRNGVRLNVSGCELPSIAVSPEISFATSLQNPEITGGISYKDRNFRGLGEKLDVVLSNSELLGGGILQWPKLVAHWVDNCLGTQSNVKVGFEFDHVTDPQLQAIPLIAANRLTVMENNGSVVHFSNIFLKTESHLQNPRSSLMKSIVSSLGIKEMSQTFEPFLRRMVVHVGAVPLAWKYTGAKLGVSISHYSGISFCGWHEQGASTGQHLPINCKQKVNHFEAELLSPPIALLHHGGRQASTIQSKRLPAGKNGMLHDSGLAALNTSSYLAMNKMIAFERFRNLFAHVEGLVSTQARANIWRTWGSGAVPNLHHCNLLKNPIASRGLTKSFFDTNDVSDHCSTDVYSVKTQIVFSLVAYEIVPLQEHLKCQVYNP